MTISAHDHPLQAQLPQPTGIPEPLRSKHDSDIVNTLYHFLVGSPTLANAYHTRTYTALTKRINPSPNPLPSPT